MNECPSLSFRLRFGGDLAGGIEGHWPGEGTLCGAAKGLRQQGEVGLKMCCPGGQQSHGNGAPMNAVIKPLQRSAAPWTSLLGGGEGMKLPGNETES